MNAAAKALDAVDAAINATFPRPGNWRWGANPVSRSVSLGTHRCEAMTFGRWGMGGAEPRFLTKYHDDGSFVLRDAREFLRAIPGREHHDWAKRIEHPVANVIALGVNLSAPLAAVVRAAAEYREAQECLDVANGRIQAAGTAGFDDSVRESSVACERMESARAALFAALDAFNAAALAQGFQ